MRSEPETSTSDGVPSWDIFCAVVDNYGDIGVCWRLARQLAAEHGYRVRLWLDDLASLHKICPDLDPHRNQQHLRGVEVRLWVADFPAVDPATVVIEAFACRLPDSYVQAMASAKISPVWINLEYLSAEPWVKECHALASPHPRLPLTKHFFFPGFVPGTGGLLAEKTLQQQRQAFLSNVEEQNNFWRVFDMAPPRDEEELRISLFCYENAPVAKMLSIWAEGEQPITCLVPEGVATQQISQFFDHAEINKGTVFQKQRLTVRIYPFLEQDRYDRLLWGCQLNFVRGEDSFVRAQWAARPMVWQIYPQEELTHWPKLLAFLDNFQVGLDAEAASIYSAFTQAWNRGDVTAQEWEAMWSRHSALAEQAAGRPAKLLQHGDLTTNLVNFFKNQLQ